MKKVLLIAIVLICTMFAQAQNYETLYVVNIDWTDIYTYCESSVDGVIVYGVDGCNQNRFQINNPPSIWCDSIIVTNEYADPDGYVYINFFGCGNDVSFVIGFTTSSIQNPFPEPFIWKRQGEAVSLEAYGGSVLWSTGETANEIEVSEPGTYSVTITDVCGSETFSLEVRDNVELYRATIDLESNLNKTTWRVTPEQAEYINEVKIYRDGMFVGTASYENGYFLDAIGSDNAARNYRLVAVTTEGVECPLPSYQLGTLHVDFSPNANDPNKINMAWTPPYIEEGAPLTVTYFQICKYDPATGEVTVVDQIGANNTIGSYDVNLFDGGYATVAAVFSEGKAYEELSFSNLTTDILGLGENEENAFRVYPNPAKDHFTVAGNGTMRITNVLGQEIMMKEIHETETVELPTGMYFVTLNGNTRKIVVE